MPQTSTWDASQLALTFGNILVDSGFGEGSICKVTTDQPRWGVHKGADGSMTRYKILAKMAKCAITMSQASIINDLFSAQYITDHATPGGAGMSSFLLKDLGGTTVVTAAHAFIEGPPEGEWSTEVKEREWSLVLLDAEIFFGGNTPE